MMPNLNTLGIDNKWQRVKNTDAQNTPIKVNALASHTTNLSQPQQQTWTGTACTHITWSLNIFLTK